MTDEIFADNIGEITVTGSLVRLDLVSLSPTERDHDNSPKPVFRQRIIMPVQSFMEAYDLMSRVAKELVDAGAVRRVSAEVARPASSRQHSPNFS